MATMIGTAGTDTLAGTVASDLLQGLGGDDALDGDLGNDTHDMALVGALGSADSTRLWGVEEAVLTNSGSKIRVQALFLDDLGRITSASGGTVEIVNIGTWTNTGTHDSGYVLWRADGAVDVWISETCTVVGV